jgi:hypothetical protein
MEGHGAVIWGKMRSPEWQELTVALNVTLHTFADVGLDRSARDDVVWRFCQTHGYYLLTSNR